MKCYAIKHEDKFISLEYNNTRYGDDAYVDVRLIKEGDIFLATTYTRCKEIIDSIIEFSYIDGFMMCIRPVYKNYKAIKDYKIVEYNLVESKGD